MSEHAQLLFANDAFYVAFATRDFAAMDALWAESATVTCIHPGWAVLTGRAKVMASWHSILSNPDAPQIGCTHAEAIPLGDAGYVTCLERLEDGYLAATNIFVRQDGRWRMRHHHASPAPAPQSLETQPPSSLQ